MKRYTPLLLPLLLFLTVCAFAEKPKKTPTEKLKAPAIKEGNQKKVEQFLGKKCRSMYVEILGFHSDPSFKYHRFDETGPFFKWMDESFALFDYASEARNKFGIGFDYPDLTIYGCTELLMHLGAAYNDERGDESFISLQLKNDIDKILKTDRYKHEYPQLD